MQAQTFEKWNAKIGFISPEEGTDYEYHVYADGTTPKELRKAILEKIKFLEANHRVVKTIDVIHTINSHLTFSKEEYLSGKVKRDK